MSDTFELNLDELKYKIKTLIKREPTLIEVTYKSKKGFIPGYFNYGDRNKLNAIFSETEKEAYEKWYKILSTRAEELK